MKTTLKARAQQGGQTIYQTMLIISCVAVAIAAVFPICEYFTLYKGQKIAHMNAPALPPEVVFAEAPPAVPEGAAGATTTTLAPTTDAAVTTTPAPAAVGAAPTTTSPTAAPSSAPPPAGAPTQP